MADCCIRVNALLEYFKWILTVQHLKGRLFLPLLPIQKGGGWLLVLSIYYFFVIKESVPHIQSLLVTIKGRGHGGSRYNCYKDWGEAIHKWFYHPMGLLMLHLNYSISS